MQPFVFQVTVTDNMVRKYKNKTTRGEWSKEAMKKAVEDVLAKKSGYRKAAATYGVPQTTLERYVNKVKQGKEVNVRRAIRAYKKSI